MTGVLDLTFTERHRFRPFQVVADGFEQLTADAAEVRDVVVAEASPPAPFAAVEVEVSRVGGVVVAGLDGGDDRLVATYDPGRRQVTLEVRAQGRTRVVRRRRVDLPDAFTLGFALCENQVTVLARTDTWRPLLTERTKVARLLDLRDPAMLSGFRYCWGVRESTARLGVRAGPFGMTGLRDPHVVQHADGRPYVRDGRVHLTWTCAGLGGFRAAHWGVFALDVDDPTRMEQVAQLYSRREGLVLGDHAGQLVRDGDRWLVATSSWGDFEGSGVHVRHTESTADLLSGVHLLDTERTLVPTDVSSWDPGFTRVDGRWFLGFVESPSQRPFDFHPTLLSTEQPSPWEGLTRVAAAHDLHQCEGPVLIEVDGDRWLLASDGRAREFPVFDLALHRVGRLAAPYPTNIPHPQLIARDDGSWLMVTFDGTAYARRPMGYGGHGDVVVLASPPV